MTQQLAQAIEAFRAESFVDVYDDEQPTVAVAALTHPDEAMGRCDLVAEAFSLFLIDRGIMNEVAVTENACDWGFRGTSPQGFPVEHGGIHHAVLVEGVMVDWAASQFLGESAFPKVWAV